MTIANAVSTVCLYAVMAQSWNLIGGMAGYASFGQVVFFGVGGYTVGTLMVHAQLSFWLALPLGALAAAAYGALIGGPLLRLRGEYFAVATLVAAEATQALASWPPVISTGDGAGLTITTIGSHRPTPYLGPEGFAALFATLALLALATLAAVRRSRFGYALRAIRDDEALAGAIGIRTGPCKLAAFALSGAIAGLAGGTAAFQAVTLTPGELFDPKITLLSIAMVVVGGAGTLAGPLVGAVALSALSAGLGAVLPAAKEVVLAALILIAVVLAPRGVTGRGQPLARLMLRQASATSSTRALRS